MPTHNDVQQFNLTLINISHELRNPLTLIHSTMQLIEKQNPEVKNNAYWTQLSLDVKDVMDLSCDISTYNQYENLNISYVNLIVMIQHLMQSFSALAKEKNISLSFSFPKNIPSYIESYPCDRIKLKQVFTNIMKNALESFESSAKYPYLKISIQHADSQKFVINFENNGPRIPALFLESIFQPFVTQKSCGRGIGLAVARKIVSLHSGHITANSDDSHTIFSITLPASATPDSYIV